MTVRALARSGTIMILDRFLQRFGEALQNKDSRRRFFESAGRWAKRLLLALTAAYFISIFTVVILMRSVGENNVTLAFLLYLPRYGFLLPLPALLLLTLPFHWRLALAQIPLGFLFIKFGMDWKHGPASGPVFLEPSERPAGTLTILTWNRGQHLNQSLQPFKNLTRPDVIALQDAPHRAKRYASSPDYAELPHAASDGEFTLISRFPIRSATPVKRPIENGRPQAFPTSRFEVDFNGQLVAIYCVHAVSPRDTLSYYKRGAFLYGILGIPGTPWGEKRKTNQQFWDQRIAAAKKLAEHVEKERIPFLVAGDFNSPAGGFIHGFFADRWQDAHLTGGRGLGHTFPGASRIPGAPWLRIDYIFAGDDWTVSHAVTEDGRPSQHLALTASLQLTPSRKAD